MARRRYRGGMRSPRRKKSRKPRPQPLVSKVPDTPQAQLEEETRSDVERLVKLRDRDVGLSEAERMLDRILEQHPEHAELFRDCADWKASGDPESPFLHVALHRVVEQRVVSREIGRFDANVSWHDAVHAALGDVAEELLASQADEEVGAETSS